MTAPTEWLMFELDRRERIIEDQANTLYAKDAQIVILRAVLTQILEGARDPISLAEIGLREAGL
jgi:hypothetical protein